MGKEGISLPEENRTWEEISTKISICMIKDNRILGLTFPHSGHFWVLGFCPPTVLSVFSLHTRWLAFP